MGSVVPMARRAQAEMSIFVEVGWDYDKRQPLNQFIFDFGCGCLPIIKPVGLVTAGWTRSLSTIYMPTT